MNRRQLLRNAVALVVAPRLLADLPPITPRTVTPAPAVVGQYNYSAVYRAPSLTTMNRALRAQRFEWLEDELHPITAERFEHVPVERRIWLGDP